MGSVKVCPVCTTRNPNDAKICSNCPTSLVGVFPRDDADLPPPPPPEPPPTVTESRTQKRPPPGSLVLDFPWGPQTIEGETLLGYQNPALRPHIEKLGEPGRHVSGAHAIILRRDGRFFIRHLSKTNGTYLDDIAVRGEAELRHGQKLSLSRQVDIMVLLG